jgi:glutamine cyclotransferase
MRLSRLLPRLREFRLLPALALVASGCGHMQALEMTRLMSPLETPQNSGQIPVLNVKLVRTYPHDPRAFTQGLEYYAGYLYESTGIAGQSTLRKVALETGEVIQKANLPSQYFGED